MTASERHTETTEQDGQRYAAETGRAATEGSPRAMGAGTAHGAAEPRREPSGWLRGLDDPRRKSPALACILSAMPGLGQIYVGYYPRGFTHAVVIAGLIALLSNGDGNEPLTPFAALFMAFFWLYNIIDAGRRAAMYNHLLAGGEAVDLPQDISMPGLRGSIVGGVVSIAAGVVLLSHTAYDFSLAWVEDWWPAGLLLFGAYLVAKGVIEKRQV